MEGKGCATCAAEKMKAVEEGLQNESREEAATQQYYTSVARKKGTGRQHQVVSTGPMRSTCSTPGLHSIRCFLSSAADSLLHTLQLRDQVACRLKQMRWGQSSRGHILEKQHEQTVCVQGCQRIVLPDRLSRGSLNFSSFSVWYLLTAF